MQPGYYPFRKEQVIPRRDVEEMQQIYGRKSSGRTAPAPSNPG